MRRECCWRSRWLARLLRSVTRRRRLRGRGIGTTTRTTTMMRTKTRDQATSPSNRATRVSRSRRATRPSAPIHPEEERRGIVPLLPPPPLSPLRNPTTGLIHDLNPLPQTSPSPSPRANERPLAPPNRQEDRLTPFALPSGVQRGKDEACLSDSMLVLRRRRPRG